MLAASDMAGAMAMVEELGGRKAATLFLGLIADGDNIVKFQAVSVLGQVVRGLAASDLEAGREIMRRLVWSLNEESGAVPWGSPEAMGEIMACEERLANEFINLLVSYIWPEGNYIEFEPLQSAVAWGLGRVAKTHPGLLSRCGAAEPLLDLLTSPDAQVRGCGAWALGFFADARVTGRLEALQGDPEPCSIFESSRLTIKTVGQLASASAKMAAARPDSLA